MRRASLFLALLLITGCVPRINSQGIFFDPISWSDGGTVTPVVDPKIVEHELRILLLVDSAGKPMSSKMTSLLGSQSFRDFWKSNCVKDEKGNPQFRQADGTKNPDGTWKGGFDGEWLKMVTDHPPTELPWIILVNGSAGTGVKPPEDPDEFAKLLNKYAGFE